MTTKKDLISLIVPSYNEEKTISIFYEATNKITTKMKNVDFEFLFIDDGSCDDTLKIIKDLAKKDKRVRYISFSRNFGKEAAIYAGLSRSTGDYVALMDADLQHPPELLKEMLEAVENEGYDCAAARRISRRGEPKIRSFFARAFYYLIKRVTVIDLVPGATDYRLMKRKMVEAIVSMTERERFTKGIYSWVGFRNKWIEYENVERVAGRTKWSIRGLFSYAYHGFIAFATTPLRAVIYLGMWIVLFAVAYAVFVFISALRSPGARTGYASILIVMLLLGGIIITILGMIGEYLARIYMEVKKRPIYFERESYFEYDIKENEDEG